MPTLSSHKDSDLFLKQLRNIIEQATVEKTDIEKATFAYVCEHHGPNYLRITQVEEKLTYIFDHLILTRKLKYYNMNIFDFAMEMHRIGFMVNENN